MLTKISPGKTPHQIKKFTNGSSYDIYNYLGSHHKTINGIKGYIFRVWAPHAIKVSVVGDFNSWDNNINPMSKISNGIFECFVPDVKEYDNYKYWIFTAYGNELWKADPFAFHSETRPDTASKVYNFKNKFRWSDSPWNDYIKSLDIYHSPMNIYEVHLGSWKKYDDGNFLDYRTYADKLIPYVKEMGYTHIEILPLTEYPYDGSWGYQVTGYFSITSRYGRPEDFKYFVNKAHKAGIGVIMDWVPAHFPKDAHGLYEFDGDTLFEYDDPTKREHEGWGTRIFDFSKPQVKSFLISSAMFWIKEYHIDGLRVDAVSAMIYLDYGKQEGEWRPNKNGGSENLEAVDFLKQLNTTILTDFPKALMIAEESTAWPMVTKPPYDGGLGFCFKWNMGWMNDVLNYVKTDPINRKFEHDKLTFPLMYAFSENYILPISHDEVVHGKGSLLNKMPGFYVDKFAGMRGFLMYMLSTPGKKLMFMGQELGQFIEWDFKKQLDWLLLKYDAHNKLLKYYKDANHFYLSNRPMWEIDDSWDGFQWIDADNKNDNVISYRRMDRKGNELIFIINFSPIERNDFWVGVPDCKGYNEVFNSDNELYGGNGHINKGLIKVSKGEIHGQKQHISITLPSLAAVVLRCNDEDISHNVN